MGPEDPYSRPQGNGMPPYNQHDPYHQQYGPVPNNGKAIAALVLGISSIVSIMIFPGIGIILGILAVIFAVIALKELRQRYQQGRGLAIGGLVCGIIGFVIHALVVLFIVVIIGASLASYSPVGSDNWEPTFEQDSNSDFY
ncbi:MULTISPECIES: DUF4190 domain-containing protein [Paenibacillus]|uniref:DUF4190 domain-containing protein n=1 Tax=Paenibacillus TaxID=44249 RepID=UPI0003764AD3|nr:MULTISPECIES: DUF4190 domain-containing protein [Paenibacillus]